MGTTKNPVIAAGNIHIIISHVLDVPQIANETSDVIHPTPNNIKSNGLNTLNINILFLAFAGIKYELYSFTLYHTPLFF